MIQSTNAFILSYLKYGDSSIILNCFTQNFGFKTFIIKNAFLKKNKSKCFPKTEFIGNPPICSTTWINSCISNSIGLVKENILSLRYFVCNDATIATNFLGCQFV